MKVSVKKRQLRPGSLVTVIIFLFIFWTATSSVIAASASGNWYRNGITMSGWHQASFVGGNNRKIDAWSSGHTPIYGYLQQLHVFGYLQDRCKVNNVWQPWQQFASGANSTSYNPSVNMSAMGQYQNCAQGHEYRNYSLHIFVHSPHSVNEGHYLCSHPDFWPTCP